jgi:hypothetical protein
LGESRAGEGSAETEIVVEASAERAERSFPASSPRLRLDDGGGDGNGAR